MRKRLLAIIATAAMVVAMVPSMVFGAESVVKTEGQLTEALNDPSIDKIVLGDSFEVKNMITIPRDVTIDGAGYTITGTEKKTTMAVMDDSEGVDLTLVNLKITNNYVGAGTSQGSCTVTHRGIGGSLTIDNCVLTCTAPRNTQPVTIGGSDKSEIKVTIKNSTVQTAESAIGHGYGITSFRKVNLTVEGSEIINGYSAINMNKSDSSNSVVKIVDSTLTSVNNNADGASNTFGTIAVGGDNIKIDVVNSTIKATNNSASDDVKQFAVVFVSSQDEAGNIEILSQNSTVTVDEKSTVVIDGVKGKDDVAKNNLGDNNNAVVINGATVKGTASPEITSDICGHKNTSVVAIEGKEATCIKDGAGYTTCSDCGYVDDSKELVIKATGHDYVGGKCSVCGEAKPVAKPEKSPATGDNSMAPFAAAGLALAAMAAVVVTRRRTN